MGKFERRTVVVFGESAAGMTPLIKRYVNGTFDGAYAPTPMYEKYLTSIVKLTIIDTGSSCSPCFRKNMYENQKIDVALLCCSSDPRDHDFENLQCDTRDENCMSEFRQYHPDVPVVLVGTMIDLVIDQTPEHKRTRIEARQQLAQEIGAVCFVECSALKNQGVREVFDKAIDVTESKLTTLERRSRMYMGLPRHAKNNDGQSDASTSSINTKHNKLN